MKVKKVAKPEKRTEKKGAFRGADDWEEEWVK